MNRQSFSPKCELDVLLVVALLDNFLMPTWMIDILIYFSFSGVGLDSNLFENEIDRELMLTTWVCVFLSYFIIWITL